MHKWLEASNMDISITDKIHSIQTHLQNLGIDGWLFYDFCRLNPLAYQVLDIPESLLTTRRFFYWVPASGAPIKVVHQVEPYVLNHLPGETLLYTRWDDLERGLQAHLPSQGKVAMEYSPNNMIPYVSFVDGGTLEFIRSLGVEVVTSADLLQYFTSVLSDDQLKTHQEAATIVEKIVGEAWDMISQSVKQGHELTEWQVQQWILTKFTENNCVTSASPMCLVDEHSADPHYFPSEQEAKKITKGSYVLIDLWCKRNSPGAIYADITRVGVCAPSPSAKQQELFSIVHEAQKSAIQLIRSRLRNKDPLMGWEVDALCRQIITDAGYGDYFSHRTGHSIDTHDHGYGAHLDNFETQDHRQILPGSCFSIEPGIYLPGEFGLRLECNVYISLDGDVHISGGEQKQMLTI